MVFIALKPCRFGGTDYKIGDSIPQEKVFPERAEALHQMGIITVGFEEIANRLNESVCMTTIRAGGDFLVPKTGQLVSPIQGGTQTDENSRERQTASCIHADVQCCAWCPFGCQDLGDRTVESVAAPCDAYHCAALRRTRSEAGR